MDGANMFGAPSLSQEDFTSGQGASKNDYTDEFGYGLWNGITGKGQELATQNAFTDYQTDKANSFSAQEAAKNRTWQEYMSNTAYQRQMADMRAAGINPLNANMTGATTPAGATAQGKAGQAHGEGADFGKFLESIAGIIATVATTSGKIASSEKIAAEEIAAKKAVATDMIKGKAALEDSKFFHDQLKSEYNWKNKNAMFNENWRLKYRLEDQKYKADMNKLLEKIESQSDLQQKKLDAMSQMNDKRIEAASARQLDRIAKKRGADFDKALAYYAYKTGDMEVAKSNDFWDLATKVARKH